MTEVDRWCLVKVVCISHLIHLLLGFTPGYPICPPAESGTGGGDPSKQTLDTSSMGSWDSSMMGMK